MYHPTTLTTMAENHTDDLMREAAGSLRAHRPRRGGGSTADRAGGGLLASHPRLVTTVMALLVAFGLSNLL